MTISPALKGIALLVATFGGGVAAGIVYERHDAVAHEMTSMQAHDAMHQLAGELDLDGAQQQAIADILARHQKDIDSAWHTMEPHVRATMTSAHDEIARVLRPEQAEKFRRIMSVMHPAGHR